MRNNAPNVKAGGTIAPARFVKLDTADHSVVQATNGTGGLGDKAVGISQPGQKGAPGVAGSDIAVAASSGDNIQIFSFGDVCELTVGTATVTAGDPIKSDANGKAATASITGDNVCAYAIETGTAGAIILVQIASPSKF